MSIILINMAQVYQLHPVLYGYSKEFPVTLGVFYPISFVSSSKHQVNPYLYWKLDFRTEGISLEMSCHLCSTIKCQLLWVWLLPETDQISAIPFAGLHKTLVGWECITLVSMYGWIYDTQKVRAHLSVFIHVYKIIIVFVYFKYICNTGKWYPLYY